MRHATLTVLMMTAIPSIASAQTTDIPIDLLVNENGAVTRASSSGAKFQDRAPRSAARSIATNYGGDTGPDIRLRCDESSFLSPSQAEDLTRRIATEENFYPDFVVDIARRGSRFDATARSPTGAYGLMQLSQPIAARFGVDRCKPDDNVRGGVRYLRHLHARYRNPFHILAAYHTGEDAVTEHKGVPPFANTVRYIADVMNDFYGWPSAAAGKPIPLAADGGETRPTLAKVQNAPTRPSSASPKQQDWLVLHVE